MAWFKKHGAEHKVVQILLLNKGSKERSAKLELLPNKGNFHHNRKVLETGFGELILVRRPKQEIDLDDYGACSSCLGFYAKSDLYKRWPQ